MAKSSIRKNAEQKVDTAIKNAFENTQESFTDIAKNLGCSRQALHLWKTNARRIPAWLIIALHDTKIIDLTKHLNEDVER